MISGKKGEEVTQPGDQAKADAYADEDHKLIQSDLTKRILD